MSAIKTMIDLFKAVVLNNKPPAETAAKDKPGRVPLKEKEVGIENKKGAFSKELEGVRKSNSNEIKDIYDKKSQEKNEVFNNSHIPQVMTSTQTNPSLLKEEDTQTLPFSVKATEMSGDVSLVSAGFLGDKHGGIEHWPKISQPVGQTGTVGEADKIPEISLQKQKSLELTHIPSEVLEEKKAEVGVLDSLKSVPGRIKGHIEPKGPNFEKPQMNTLHEKTDSPTRSVSPLGFNPRLGSGHGGVKASLSGQAPAFFNEQGQSIAARNSGFQHQSEHEHEQGSLKFHSMAPASFAGDTDRNLPLGQKDPVVFAPFSETEIDVPDDEAVLRQVSRFLQSWKPGQGEPMRFLLEPKQLGMLQIDISFQENEIIAHMLTADPFVKNLLEGNQNFLHNSLKAQGFHIQHFSVGLENQAGSFHRQHAASHFSGARLAKLAHPRNWANTPQENMSVIRDGGQLSLYI